MLPSTPNAYEGKERCMPFTITGISILLIILGFTVYGIKAGLIRAVFSLFSIFFTTVFTWLIYPWVAGLLMNTPLFNGIRDWIFHSLDSNQQMAQSMPEFFQNLPGFLRNSVEKAVTQTTDSILVYCAEALAVLTINVISILLLFVGIRLLITLVKKIGKAVNKVKIIGPVNSFLGGIFGCVQGIIVVYLIIMVISYLPTTKAYEVVRDDLQVSAVGRILYNERITLFGMKPRYPL